MCQSEGTRQIVMSFSPHVAGCLIKKAHKRGITGTPEPPPLPNLATPLQEVKHMAFCRNVISIEHTYITFFFLAFWLAVLPFREKRDCVVQKKKSINTITNEP